MAYYLITYNFSQGPFGWSEKFNMLASSFQAAIDASADNTILAARQALLGAAAAAGGYSATLNSVRISDVAVKRDSVVRVVNAQGAASPTNDTADIPNTCLVVRMNLSSDPNGVGSLYRRTLYLRGFPDGLVSNGGKYTPTAGWVTAFTLWVNLLRDRSFGTIVSSKEEPLLNIMAAANDGANTLFTTDVNNNFPNGRQVHFTGQKPSAIFGTYKTVYQVAGQPAQFRVLGQNIVGVPTTLGQVNLVASAFGYIVGTPQVVRASHRVTGRPSDAPRGRRKKRATA